MNWTNTLLHGQQSRYLATCEATKLRYEDLAVAPSFPEKAKCTYARREHLKQTLIGVTISTQRATYRTHVQRLDQPFAFGYPG
eukprot:1333715-Amorphochlora_amoeboformis.AAC.2